MDGSGKFDQGNSPYSYSSYRGGFIPEDIIFNTNLQGFARRVEVICGLQTGGKISSDTAYNQIQQLYQQLKQSRELLGIVDHSISPERPKVTESFQMFGEEI